MNYVLQWVAASDTGHVREVNEDSVRIYPDRETVERYPEQTRPERSLCIVADGMGGHVGGVEASSLAVTRVPQIYYHQEGVPPDQALVLAVRQASQEMVQMGQSNAQLQGMGTTIVAVVAEGEQAFVVNVGDSRAYLLRQGVLQLLTYDDRMVAQQLREGRLSEEEARNHEYRNMLLQCLGKAGEIEPHLRSFLLQPDDRLLLCSDGLFEVVDDTTIAHVLQQYAPQEAAQYLVQLAIEHQTTDNITVAVGSYAPMQSFQPMDIGITQPVRTTPGVTRTEPHQVVRPADGNTREKQGQRRKQGKNIGWCGVVLVVALIAGGVFGVLAGLVVKGGLFVAGGGLVLTPTPTEVSAVVGDTAVSTTPTAISPTLLPQPDGNPLPTVPVPYVEVWELDLNAPNPDTPPVVQVLANQCPPGAGQASFIVTCSDYVMGPSVDFHFGGTELVAGIEPSKWYRDQCFSFPPPPQVTVVVGSQPPRTLTRPYPFAAGKTYQVHLTERDVAVIARWPALAQLPATEREQQLANLCPDMPGHARVIVSGETTGPVETVNPQTGGTRYDLHVNQIDGGFYCHEVNVGVDRVQIDGTVVPVRLQAGTLYIVR